MSTRSSILFVDEQGRPVANLYGQYDGYLDSRGRDLASFLAGKTMVNGFSDGSTHRQFNGIGDLAVRTIATLKGNPNVIGGNYMVPLDQTEEYSYTVTGVEGQEPTIGVEFYGDSFGPMPASEFLALCES